jgi:hypothetical protein
MIKNSTLKIGGNVIKVWIGSFFKSIGETFTYFGNKTIADGKVKIVTNPSAKLYNPFTLMIGFTVDANQKYQIILQGNYKEKYKETEDGFLNISEHDMFMIIGSTRKQWFKKE